MYVELHAHVYIGATYRAQVNARGSSHVGMFKMTDGYF